MADTAVKEKKQETVPLGTEPKPQAKSRAVRAKDRQMVQQRLVQAQVGTWVQWYETADPRQQPWPALVYGKGGDDRNHLLVVRMSGRAKQEMVRENVPHMSDPILTVKKPLPGQPYRGAWDFNPDFVPERYKGVNAMSYRIVLLHQIHAYSALQCAQAIGGGWTTKLVQAVLDEHANR